MCENPLKIVASDKKKSENVWYFAYGSNLYIPQMLERVGIWKTSKKARLKGWKLVFNVNSHKWSGGTANIVKAKDHDIVYGVIYLISSLQLEILTEYEGLPPTNIKVASKGKEIDAKTFIFKQDKPSLKPTQRYLDTIICGLKQHGYGNKVINKLKQAVI